MFIRLYQQLIGLSYWHLYVFAFLCFLPALFSPFYSDDFFHLLLVEAYFEQAQAASLLKRDMQGSILGLFAFVDDVPAHVDQLRQFSLVPWWADDDFYFRFWRPVSELSHILDYALFPRSAFWAHLHNIALFLFGAYLFQCLVVTLVQKSKEFKLEDSQYSATAISFLAICIYLIDGQHVATVSWVANRNALIAAVFSLLAMGRFMAWCDELEVCADSKVDTLAYSWIRMLKALLLGLLLWLLALLSGEAALAMSAYFFAYVVVFMRLSWGYRCVSLLPFFTLSILWMFCHQYLGYGAEPSGNSYINPLSHPWVFVSAMIDRVPVYWFANLTSSPAGAYWTVGNAVEGFEFAYWLCSITLTVYLLWLARQFILRSSLMQFSLIAFAFAALPAALANPQDRLALFLSFASAMFFAVLLQQLFVLVQEKKAVGRSRLYVVFTLFFFLQLIVSPLHLLLGSAYMRYEALMINEQIVQFDTDDSVADKRVVFLDLPLGYNVMMVGVRAYYDRPLPLSSFYLGNDKGVLRLSVLNNHEMLVSRHPAFATGHERYLRNAEDNPYSVGEINKQAGIQTTIQELNKAGLPKTLTMKYTGDISDYMFYQWRQGVIQKVDIMTCCR